MTAGKFLGVGTRPRAVAMWDFSWLERRWPGGGYECWERALDELVERGYDLVRIDVYPHCLAAGREAFWDFLPTNWTIWDWGSPQEIRLRVGPEVEEFMGLCRERGVRLALSTWFREERTGLRGRIRSPRHHAEVWLEALAPWGESGLLEGVDWVDLCNEFPGEKWAPFFDNSPDSSWRGSTPRAVEWMREAVEVFRQGCPGVACTVSFAGMPPEDGGRLNFLDFLEPHIWMAHARDGEYYQRLGYNYPCFDESGPELVARAAGPLYRASEEYWLEGLRGHIERWVEVSRACGRPLATTECWAVVDGKDWPGMDWGWIKEVCAFGVEEALGTGRFAAIATSNFCGPQFRGMWDDVGWHQRLTGAIKRGAAPVCD